MYVHVRVAGCKEVCHKSRGHRNYNSVACGRTGAFQVFGTVNVTLECRSCDPTQRFQLALSPRATSLTSSPRFAITKAWRSDLDKSVTADSRSHQTRQYKIPAVSSFTSSTREQPVTRLGYDGRQYATSSSRSDILLFGPRH